jgi:peptidoglycan/LPS O-acetylase OafA/YrhL
VWQVALPRRLLSPQAALLLLLISPVVPANTIAQEVALYVVLPYAVLSFATARPALFGLAGQFGDFSYGIYVYGFLIEQIMSHYFKTDGKPLLNFGFSLFPTLLLAAASWHIIEKPFLKLKPKGRRAANLAVTREQTGGSNLKIDSGGNAEIALKSIRSNWAAPSILGFPPSPNPKEPTDMA